MKILILSSSSRHFPLDIQDSLKEAGLESHRLGSLNEFIASPLRKEPFLAILEVGTTEDIDRALVAYEWAETVQPLAAARYLLLVGSKHISLQEKSGRFRGVEIAQLPLPTKNLLFKVELQLKVLSSESKTKIERKFDGFSAEVREVEKQRVMVIRGIGPKEGGWKNSGEAPQGRTRWRWIDDPPKKGKPEEKFSWSAESKAAPVFNTEINAWEVKDPEADLQCHRDGKELFSAKKSGQLGPAGSEATTSSIPAKTSPSPAPEAKAGGPAESAGGSRVAASAPPSAQNNLVSANPAAPLAKAPAAPVAAPQPEKKSMAVFSGAELKGANPLRVEAPAQPVAAEKSQSPAPVAPAAEKKPAEAKPSDPATATTAAKEKPAPSAAPVASTTKASPHSELPKLGEGKAPKSPGPAAKEEPRGESAPHEPAAREKAALEKKAPVAQAEASPDFKRAPQAAPVAAQEVISPAQAPASAANSPSPQSPRGAAPRDHSSGAAAPVSPPEKKDGLASATLREKTPAPKAESVEPSTSAVAAGKNEAPAGGEAAPVAKPKPAAPAGEEPSTARALRTEVITTVQEHPAEAGQDSLSHFPEKTREITGKIVIPTTPNDSDHQNLVRSSDSRDGAERNVISSAARAPEESQHLKSRLFLTLSLEEMQDQNSSWIPVEGFRIYLSARHRYYGLREMSDVFPLWIYEGELAPEFLDLQKSWKFYDRLPQAYNSLETLPAPVARYLLDMVGAKAQVVPEGEARGESALATENKAPSVSDAPKTSSFYSGSAFSSEKPPPAAEANGLLGKIKKILGLRD
jgi:hypothetical protein